jgi:hypothetical protein
MEKLAKDALKVNNNAENEKLVLDLVQLLLDIVSVGRLIPATHRQVGPAGVMG